MQTLLISVLLFVLILLFFDSSMVFLVAEGV